MITEGNKLKHHSSKTNELVYEIDKQKKTGTYFVDKKCDFFKLTKKVTIKGFNKLPKGFSTDGFGFAKPAGTFLTKALIENFGENIKFTISDKAKTIFDKTKRELKLNHSDYLRILEPLRTFSTERNLKSNQHIAAILHELFPRTCKSASSVKSIYSYEKDKLTKIFSTDPELVSKLSKNDIELIAQINSKLEKESKTEFKYIDYHEKNRKKSEKVFLETLIKEFENRINKSLSENDWQIFLRKYILIFNTSYIKAIEKVNVDLRGKYPVFKSLLISKNYITRLQYKETDYEYILWFNDYTFQFFCTINKKYDFDYINDFELTYKDTSNQSIEVAMKQIL